LKPESSQSSAAGVIPDVRSLVEAERRIRTALVAAPNVARLHDDLGTILSRQERHLEAIPAPAVVTAVEMGLRKDDLKVSRGGWPILKRNLDRIIALTLNMLAYSRPRTLEIELTKVQPLLDDCASLLMDQCKLRGDSHEQHIAIEHARDRSQIGDRLRNIEASALGQVHIDADTDHDQRRTECITGQFDQYAAELALAMHQIVGPLELDISIAGCFERSRDRHADRERETGEESRALLEAPAQRKGQAAAKRRRPLPPAPTSSRGLPFRSKQKLVNVHTWIAA